MLGVRSLRFLPRRTGTKLRGKHFSTARMRQANATISSDFVVTNTASPTLEHPKGNFAEFLLEKSGKKEDSTALICSRSHEIVTYGALKDHMSRWGAFLDRKGVPQGGVVAVVAPNLLHTVSVIYGTVRAGRVWTGVNPAYTTEEMAHHLADAGAALVVCHAPLEATVRRALAAASKDCDVITVGSAVAGEGQVEAILRDPAVGFSEPAQVSPSDTCALLYSSGTTGLPKGAMLSHDAMIGGVHALCHPSVFYAGFATDSHQARFLCLLPLFHIAGCVVIAGTGLRGGHAVTTASAFDPRTYVETIFASEISTLHLVPSMLNFALQHPLFTKDKLPHLKSIFVGAAPVPASAAETIYDKFGDDLVLQHVYGMTETLVSVMDPVSGPVRWGYTGSPVPGMSLKIVDVETGEALPPYRDGEVLTRGGTLMSGYLNNPAATQATMGRDGWLRSGDVGHCDEQGRLCVVDRTKDLIKVNGMQVSPSELENTLLQLEGVREVAVVGVADPLRGEAPRAFLVADGSLTEEEVHRWMASRAAKHKQLAGGVRFVDAIPKNATGKILRRQLRDA